MNGAQHNTFSSVIDASFDAMRGTVDDVMAFYAREFGEMDEVSRLELRVVLNELLINAIRHGCRCDSSKKVSVEASLFGQRSASVVVEDDGDGYDASAISESIADPRGSPIDELAESGRGLAIVRSLCERFSLNDKGNKVSIRAPLRRA